MGLVRDNRARVMGLTLSEAEDVLDWLEHNGFEERGLFCDSPSSFRVEFRMDSGHVPVPLAHLKSIQPRQRYTAG
jgi:hypothetical protein